MFIKKNHTLHSHPTEREKAKDLKPDTEVAGVLSAKISRNSTFSFSECELEN
jgi:hypothetical protein